MSQDNRLVTETCCLRDRDETWNLRDRDSQKWVSRRRPSLENPPLAFTYSNATNSYIFQYQQRPIL